MASGPDRPPASSNALSGQSKAAGKSRGVVSTAARRVGTGGDGGMMEPRRSTSLKRKTSSARSPLHRVSSAGPTTPASTATPSREPSPARVPPRLSTSSTRASSRSRKNSQEVSPNRGPDSPGLGNGVGSRPLDETSKPQLPAPAVDAPPDVSSPDKSNMLPPRTAVRRADQESTTNLPNTSSKRISLPTSEDAAKTEPDGDDLNGRTTPRTTSGRGSVLETVQEASTPSTSSADKTLNLGNVNEQSRPPRIDEEPLSRVSKQAAIESGSDSGGKSSGAKDEKRRNASISARPGDVLPKRSYTSLNSARGKPGDGSVRNMIVETETVSSVPQVALGVGVGERGASGRVDPSTVRMKPSTETIRPKKEKKKQTRKPTTIPSGTVSSKADIFEAKVASAVDEADVSDSDETFVYESNPPDPIPARQHRFHSRTPSTTSMASQFEQFAGRSRAAAIREGNHSVTGKRSMKFTNNTYNNGSVDGDAGDQALSRVPSRTDGNGHTHRHHHIGRYGRNGTYPSLFDNESPFPPSQGGAKSPRHFVGNGFRQSRHGGGRNYQNYRTMGSSKKTGDAYGYDFDGEGADDERTPLVGSARVNRSRYGRRPNSASLRQLEYMEQRRRGCFSRWGSCILITFLLLVLIGGATTFIIGATKPLLDVHVAQIQNVLASEQEIMLDLDVHAVNPNLFPIAVNDMDVNIFAKSRFVGTDKFWRDHGHPADFPRVELSKRRALLGRAVNLTRRADQSSPSLVHVADGVDRGTDPIPEDPAGDPQTMLLGRVFAFDSPLTFDPSPWKHQPMSSVGEIRLERPGNKTEEGGTERWERVLQHPFELIVRGVVKYQLPLSSRLHSASVSSSVRVVPDGDSGGDDDDHDPPPSNNTVRINVGRERPVRTARLPVDIPAESPRPPVRQARSFQA